MKRNSRPFELALLRNLVSHYILILALTKTDKKSNPPEIFYYSCVDQLYFFTPKTVELLSQVPLSRNLRCYEGINFKILAHAFTET